MAKVDVDVVASILKESEIEPQVVAQIMRKLQQELKIQEEMAEATREPRVKSQYVVLLSDPLNQVAADDLLIDIEVATQAPPLETVPSTG